MGLLISLFQIFFLKLYQHFIPPGKSFSEILFFTKAKISDIYGWTLGLYNLLEYEDKGGIFSWG